MSNDQLGQFTQVASGIRLEAMAAERELHIKLLRALRDHEEMDGTAGGHPSMVESLEAATQRIWETAVSLDAPPTADGPAGPTIGSIRRIFDDVVAEALALHADGRQSRVGDFFAGFGRPALEKRVMQWRMLNDRLDAWKELPPAKEVGDLTREYDYLRAWQGGMTFKVVAYQMLLLIALTVLIVLRPVEGLLFDFMFCGYFGAVGAIAASLWGTVRHSSARTLRPNMMASHMIKPLLGLVLGTLVILLLPDLLADAGDPGTLTVPEEATNPAALALSALAGLNEHTFMMKVKDVAAALLGRREEKEPA